MASFDPLDGSSSSAFVNDAVLNPPWPTTPHTPDSVPAIFGASAVPPTPEKGPTLGIYGREPRIYGQPDPGLISPRDHNGLNGANYEKREPYLRVRITGLDRNRRDILIKLDAQTNLPNFSSQSYRNVSRSFYEFQQLYDSIFMSNPQTIIPALPLAQTSAPTDEEDDRLVKIMLQRWITRVCEDPILLHDEDIRSFIESDFGYQPTPRPKRKTSTGFSLMRRGVPDEDSELQKARFELTKLEGLFFEAAKAVDRLSISRKSLASVHGEMGNKLVNVATGEAHPPLSNAFKKIGRAWHNLADLDHAQAISECVVLGDSFGYQGMNARSAKETLQMRTGVLEEYQAAAKVTISKRRQLERLKASSNIRPERVDEALEEMEEANRYEQVLARRAEGISQNLHRALRAHNRHANDDVMTALIEHARSSLMYEKQLLRELEALRSDVENAAKKVVPATNIPKPRIIPPLEEFSQHPRPPPSAPPSNGFHRPPISQYHAPPHTALPPDSPVPSRPRVTQPPGLPSEPLSASSIASYDSNVSGQSTATTHASPGGRFADGTQSMIVQPTSTPVRAPLAASSSTSAIPSTSDSVQVPPQPPQSVQTAPAVAADPLGALASATPVVKLQPAAGVDPLANIRPTRMSSSVRLSSHRPRLDPKEAASKLANMF